MKDERVRTALVSVYDKAGIAELCRDLHAAGVGILSSGGTARLLREAGVPVREVSDYTGSPEVLDGRVKTLHPRIHAGILAVRSNAAHMAELEHSGIVSIDLVVVNLYPFEKTSSAQGATLEQAVEMIDVGGPTLLRAAAKNFSDVAVVVDPADYGAVSGAIRERGCVAADTRAQLARKAFAHTSAYDAAIHGYLSRIFPEAPAAAGEFPERLRLELEKVLDLRYGENPHQRAAFYRDPVPAGTSLARAKQIQGKELSFNNILDLDAALALAADFGSGACAIIKHGNPAGVGLAEHPVEAFRLALACDPVSAFGGIVAFNRTVDRGAAEAVTESFYEAVLAPHFESDALEAFARKKNLRVLALGAPSQLDRSGPDLRRVHGGVLVQDWDPPARTPREGRVVTKRSPDESEWQAMELAWKVAQHVKSNAIVYAFGDRTVGIGAGQMSRVDSARLAVQKARSPLGGAAMASDAFFPFRDGVDAAAEAGISVVVQPGGSLRDAEVIAAADEHGIAMVLTGRRHFRH